MVKVAMVTLSPTANKVDLVFILFKTLDTQNTIAIIKLPEVCS
jgi:hypothetical protein